jgi:hypothetical protein
MPTENLNPQTPKLQSDALSNAAVPEGSFDTRFLQSSTEDDWCQLLPSGD